MKIFRYVMMAVLMLGVSAAARAFTFQVLDPGNAPFPVEPGVQFAAQFGDCNAPDVVGPGSQCFYAENVSVNPPTTITSLEMVIIDGPATLGQPADCDVSSPKSLFTGESCGFSGGVYTLDLTGGNITSGTPFVLVIDCDSQGNCPLADITAAVNTNGPVSMTPEPSSLWMALSGTGALGFLQRRRRRLNS